MKLIVAGSRGITDVELVHGWLDTVRLRWEGTGNDTIVSGGARGPDEIGEEYAAEVGLKVKRFPADWDTYGRRAGYLRNAQMADYADALIAFWDGSSRGTASMISLMKERRKPYVVVGVNVDGRSVP